MRSLVQIAAAAVLFAAPALADTVTIETARGPAEVPASPEKIAVFDLSAFDTLNALGVSVAGTVDKAYLDHLKDAHEKAEVVGSLFEPDFEAINAMQPDLIVVGSRSAEQLEPLSKFAPTIDMTVWGDDLLGQAKARIAAYGKLFDRADKASAFSAELDEKLAKARETVAGKGSALIVMTNGPKVSAYGKGSRFGWLHQALDLPEAVETNSENSHGEAVSFEFIRDANPDWLLVIDRSVAIGAEGARADETLDNALVAETTAWKNGQVIYLNAADLYIAGGGARSIMNTLDLLIEGFSNPS